MDSGLSDPTGNPVNNGINYQPQLVGRISFHQQHSQLLVFVVCVFFNISFRPEEHQITLFTHHLQEFSDHFFPI